MNPKTFNLIDKSFCDQVIAITKETGNFIKNSKLTSEQGIETKTFNNLVTYVDKTAEEQLVKKLGELLPQAGFIAEEGTSSKKGKIYNWIIDPLDGTTNFIHQLPSFCVSVALQKHDKMVLGVVYEINRDECFYAWEGSKAYLNSQEIKVSPTKTLQDSLIATGFPYDDFDRLDNYINVFKQLVQNTRGLRRMGAAAVDLAYVACGRFDSFYEYGLNPWDVAAGAFIVQQAGGKVSDFKGGDNYLFGEEIIASNGSTHDGLLEVIEKQFN